MIARGCALSCALVLLAATDLSGGWMFTACPAGYAPNIRFAVENKTAILNSLYNCLPARPDVEAARRSYRSALFFRSASWARASSIRA